MNFSPTADAPKIDVAVEDYASRLRDLLETLAVARKQLRDVSACQGVLRSALTGVGEVLSKEAPTEGTEGAMNRLWWLLRSTEEAEGHLNTIMETHKGALPQLIAQERVATNVLTALHSIVHGVTAESSPRRKGAHLYAVTG